MTITSTTSTTIRDIGILAMLAGVSASAIVPNDPVLLMTAGRYVVHGTDSTGGKLTTYRINANASSGIELAAFVQRLAAQQTDFDEDTATIIAKGWNKLFD